MRRSLRQARAARRGFSLIELLIAVIILGILAAILIPIVSNRTKQARLVAAETDMELIGNALASVAIDTDYFVRLWLLQYGPFGTAASPFNREENYPYQVRNIGPGGYYQNINRLFITPLTGDLVSTTEGALLLERLQQNETAFNWNGPYINYRRDRNVYAGDVSPRPDGMADDPWGNNYLLFTTRGLVLEPDGEIVTQAFLPPNTNAGVSASNLDKFDRLTLVSLGPDGLPGAGGLSEVGTGDDLVRAIGP